MPATGGRFAGSPGDSPPKDGRLRLTLGAPPVEFQGPQLRQATGPLTH
jgi:hypothetical protein